MAPINPSESIITIADERDILDIKLVERGVNQTKDEASSLRHVELTKADKYR